MILPLNGSPPAACVFSTKFSGDHGPPWKSNFRHEPEHRLRARGQPSIVITAGKLAEKVMRVSLHDDTPHGAPRKLEITRSRGSVNEIVWDVAYPVRNWMHMSTRIIPETRDIAIQSRTPISESMAKISLTMKTLSSPKIPQNKFLEPLAVTGGSESKNPSDLYRFHWISSLGSRALLDWKVPMLYLCSARLLCKIATVA